MQSEMIRAAGQIINVSQIAYALWRGRELFLNTSGGFVRLEGQEASIVWAMLEDLASYSTSKPAK